MKIADTARLLARIAAYDNRKVTPDTAAAWHDVVGDLEYPDALSGVVHHFRTSSDYLMPVDVCRHVAALRRARCLTQDQILDAMEADGIRPDHPLHWEELKARRLRAMSCQPETVPLPIGISAKAITQ